MNLDGELAVAQTSQAGIGRSHFGEDFVWGISTSAYQTEGAHNVDGKGASIWDEFSNRKGKIHKNQTGNDACLFYYKYREDLRILKELGIKNFRFSISWSRLIPDGVGAVSPKGAAFYQNLIDTCLEFGITPWITLYHWDLPQALEKQGGWTNRKIIDWFAEYAKICATLFGDRVKHWMVLNEPLVFTGAGYFFGIHAPGKRSMNGFLAAVHHATLCQAEGARVLRALVPQAEIGTTISCSHVTPRRSMFLDQRAVRKVDALLNRLFVEPFLGLGYPLNELRGLRLMEKFIKPGDEVRMVFDFDFLGVQNYTREVVRYSLLTPIVKARIVPPEKRGVDVTALNWEVFPEGIYELLMKFSAYPGIKKILVTENGAAFQDKPATSVVMDPKRSRFIKDYLAQVLRAKEAGAKVEGYFVWTMLDNFEWAEGYQPRFGLIYVDFKTQTRIVKQSALWYSEFLNA